MKTILTISLFLICLVGYSQRDETVKRSDQEITIQVHQLDSLLNTYSKSDSCIFYKRLNKWVNIKQAIWVEMDILKKRNLQGYRDAYEPYVLNRALEAMYWLTGHDIDLIGILTINH